MPEELSENETASSMNDAEEVISYSPALEAIRQPIAGDNPCGGKVTYDEHFQKVKEEVNRIGSVSTSIDQEKALSGEENTSILGEIKNIDYQMIVDLSRDILQNKSKDLSVAAYMGVGLFHTNGIVGIAEGLEILNILVQEFWEGLYPPIRRMAARKNALQFLFTKWSNELENVDVTGEDRAPLEKSIAVNKELQSFCMKEMEQHAPVWSGLTSKLNQTLRKVPKPVAPPPEETPVKPSPTPAPPATVSPAPSAETATPASDMSVQSAPQQQAPTPSAAPSIVPDQEWLSSSQANQSMIRAISFLREQNRTLPVPYRLARVLRWDQMISEPPNENGKTRVEPPNVQRRTYLSSLLQKNQWEKLAVEGEASFQQSPFHFWLDLQRLIVAAMEQLDASFESAREAILWETALLVKRLPGLPTLVFNDGTPFAEPLTLDWIEDIVKPALGKGASSVAGIVSPLEDGEDTLSGCYVDAKKLLAKGDLPGALDKLLAGTGEDRTRKHRYRRRLYIASLCISGNKPSIARPVLEELRDEIELFSLDEWEPGLAIETWKNLYKCYNALIESGAKSFDDLFRERADQAFERICRLDITAALTSVRKGS